MATHSSTENVVGTGVSLVACMDTSGILSYYGLLPCVSDTGSLRAAVSSLVVNGAAILDAHMFRSFGGKPPGRHAIVIAEHADGLGTLPSGVTAVATSDDAIALAKQMGLKAYVLGGSALFEALWASAASVHVYVTSWKAITYPKATMNPMFPQWDLVAQDSAAAHAATTRQTLHINHFGRGLQFSPESISQTVLRDLIKAQQRASAAPASLERAH